MNFLRNRNNTILLRLNDDELRSLNEKVQRTSLNREAYIRAVLSNTVPVEIPPVSYVDLLKELNRIGNNINQIATVANSLGVLNYKEYCKDYAKVEAVVDIMLEYLHPHRKSEVNKNDGVL